jgi:serine/threonine protein kinase
MPTIRVESKINSGGFGEVFRAVIVDDGRKVAVKRLAKPYSLEDAKRFGREVRIMEKLNHQNVVKVLFSNLESDPPSFVMPLAESNLNDILSDLRQSEDRRIFIFQQILDGLQYAHENGVIHRDIKPHNILILKNDRVLITDFGIGRFVTRDTTTLTVQGAQLGTVMYAAPEQLADLTQADERSDIYSLGKILYQMLTSRPVFPIPNLTGLEGKYVYIIQKCLENDPDKRYQTIRELSDDFQVLTQKEYNVEAPTQSAQKLIGEIVDPFLDAVDPKGIAELVKLFLENTDNENLYLEIFPRMPSEILKEIIKTQLQSFTSIFQVYDDYVSGGLGFSYCDTVASFYEKVFDQVDDFALRRIIINRLLNMGHNHNRWYVRDVLARIVHEIKEVGLARLTLDVFRNNGDATRWSSAAIKIDKLHPLLRDGLREINKPPEVDEFQF